MTNANTCNTRGYTSNILIAPFSRIIKNDNEAS